MTDALFPPARREIAPGAVHVPGWLDPAAQRRLVAACRAWAAARCRSGTPGCRAAA